MIKKHTPRFMTSATAAIKLQLITKMVCDSQMTNMVFFFFFLKKFNPEANKIESTMLMLENFYKNKIVFFFLCQILF